MSFFENVGIRAFQFPELGYTLYFPRGLFWAFFCGVDDFFCQLIVGPNQVILHFEPENFNF
jgi:hypothetical protein